MAKAGSIGGGFGGCGSAPAAASAILGMLGKGLTTSDLIDAHLRGPEERQRQIESEPLPATIYEVVAEAAAEIPDQLAWNFFEAGETLTYREVLDQTNRLASSLATLGVVKGSHVAVMLPNIPAFPLTWLALGRLGAVMIPVNASYTSRELDYIVNDGDAGFLVIHGDFLPVLEGMTDRPDRLADEQVVVYGSVDATNRRRFEGLLAEGDPDFVPNEVVVGEDLLNIQYTSGTTGFPKGCMLRQNYWVGTAKVAARRDGLVLKNILAHQPFYYMDPQWMTLLAAFQRGTLHAAARPSSSRFMDWVRRFDVHFCIFPEVLCKEPPHPLDGRNSLRRVNIYGVRKELHAHIERRFNVRAREAFGMTEIGATLFMPLEAVDMVGSGACGKPSAFRSCRVVDDKGKDVVPGEIGELVVKGFNILLGYYKKPEATKEAFFGEWFRTGDLFRQDEDGYFYLVGRKKDMIRRSGENIAAREVEAVLNEIPEVHDVAVVPVPDPRRKEEVKAYVILRPGLSPEQIPPEQILAHAHARLAKFKLPRYIEYRAEFPRTPSMKIRKGELLAEKPDLRAGAWDAVDGIWR